MLNPVFTEEEHKEIIDKLISQICKGKKTSLFHRHNQDNYRKGNQWTVRIEREYGSRYTHKYIPELITCIICGKKWLE